MIKMLARYIIIVSSILLCINAGASRDKAFGEYKVKAALIFKFAHYTTWSKGFTGNKSQVKLCIDGNSSVYEDFLFLSTKTAHGKSLKVSMVDQMIDLKSCDILFISSSSKFGTRKVLRYTYGLPILTVGESEHFIILGGIIRFYIKDKKTRFAISPANAKTAKLKISSRLLSVAKIEEWDSSMLQLRNLLQQGRQKPASL